MTSWLEISVGVPVADADDIAALIADGLACAASGTEIRSDTVVFWVAADQGQQALDDTRRFVATLAARGYRVDPARVAAKNAAPEEQWRDAWKKYFRTARLTRQIVVVPSWDDHTPEPDDLVISLDPGQAFGTGDHATTRVMLEQMQALADAGARFERVIDVGTGSGILAIAAVKLWPDCRVVALDVDPLAVDATIENCERNAVADRVSASATPVEDIGETFDLVLANIQAGVLTALVEPITRCAAPLSHLILSGLLASQAIGVGRAFAERLPDHVLATRPSERDPEWSVAVLDPRQ